MARRLRIFVSSPSDVSWAREIAAQTIEKLAQDYARDFDGIEPYLWEHEAMLASGHFQDSIEPPSAFDIVILVLWSRLGKPLPERTAVRAYRGIDGRTPVTGTEWEFEEALAGARAHGTPDLLVFRSREPATMDVWDAGRRAEQLRQAKDLDEFWRRHFDRPDRLTGAHASFASADDFAARLERQLRKLIETRIETKSHVSAGRTRTWTKAPFRGLESYEFEHAPIYYGQQDAIGRAMRNLAEGAEAGSPFLLIVGASGSGKSSLVKAGLLPKLFVPRRTAGAAFLRRVVFRPSDSILNEDIFDALARRLTSRASSSEGLPELISKEVAVADLAAHLRGGGADPSLPFRLTLDRLASEARSRRKMLEHESPRLVLVVDQFEEIFSDERVSDEDRIRFVELLGGLARSGLVWVVGAMRADFWHRALELPALAALASGPGRMDLPPPGAAQLGQMIRKPAEAAGLGFEVHPHTGAPLSEYIGSEVIRQPGSLPLLSYLLDQLYRSDVLEAGGEALSFATYDRLGGLQGAIATKAEEVLGRCDADARGALGSVLFRLVQLGEGAAELVARRAPLANFAAGSAQRRLVEALLDPGARLLASDSDVAEHPMVRVAHEALLSGWAQAGECLRDSVEALKVRRRIEDRYELWRSLQAAPAGHQPTGLPSIGAFSDLMARSFGFPPAKGLLTEVDLLDGRRLLSERGADLDPDISDYIERSVANDRRRRNRAVRALAAVASVVGALAVIAGVAAVNAKFQAKQALEAQSRLLTETAAERLTSGDAEDAQAILLEVLARGAGSARAISVFEQALGADPLIAVLAGHEDVVQSAKFSPDGRRIVTASRDGTARIWDAGTGAPEMILRGHSGYVTDASFSPDGRRVVTASADGTARTWDAASGAPLAILRGHQGFVETAVFSPDGRRVVTASLDRTVRVWDAASGVQEAVFQAPDAVETAALSSDGRRIATSLTDGTAQILDAATGAELVRLKGHGTAVIAAAFSPDGRRVVTGSRDRTARIWDAQNGAELAMLTGHTDVVNSVAFSPDGRRVLTASLDQTARIWDATTGAQLAILAGHAGVLNSASYSPDGTLVVTAAADGTARTWRTIPKGQLVTLIGHEGAVQSAAFSPDGSRLVTASLDRTARTWNAATGAPLATLVGHSGVVSSAAFSPDGRRVVTASFDKTARIWDAGGGAPQAVLSGHRGALTSAAFSPDGQKIVTASADRTARTWNGATGRALHIFSGHKGTVMSVTYSPDGRQLVTGSTDGAARIWDSASGRLLETLYAHAGVVESAAFSRDGRRVVTANEDGSARVWDASSGEQLMVLIGHAGAVNSATYSPDGRWIVTASDDRTVRTWRASTGEQLAAIVEPDEVNSVAYSPDGRRLATASDDGLARVFAAPSPADLDAQLAWASAAQVEPLAEVERTLLGLPVPQRRRAPSSADRTHADELADSAQREEVEAVQQSPGPVRDQLLLNAFQRYAMLYAEAARQGRTDMAARTWRYRRASLARVLAYDGLMRQAANAYRQVLGK